MIKLKLNIWLITLCLIQRLQIQILRMPNMFTIFIISSCMGSREYTYTRRKIYGQFQGGMIIVRRNIFWLSLYSCNVFFFSGKIRLGPVCENMIRTRKICKHPCKKILYCKNNEVQIRYDRLLKYVKLSNKKLLWRCKPKTKMYIWFSRYLKLI